MRVINSIQLMGKRQRNVDNDDNVYHSLFLSLKSTNDILYKIMIGKALSSEREKYPTGSSLTLPSAIVDSGTVHSTQSIRMVFVG